MALDKFTQVTKSGIVTTLEFDCTSVRATGVVTATKFVGPSEGSTGSFTGAVSITDTTNATSITTGALKITGGVGIGMSLHVGGNVSIGGTLTYEDVTNVDSVGLITARSGINVSGGELKVGTAVTVGTAGVVTATSFSGDGSTLTGITETTINANTNNYLITGTGTANTLQGESGLTFDGSALALAGNMQFTAVNAQIELNNGGPRFWSPSANTLTIHTGGGFGSSSLERLRIKSDGKVGIGLTNPSEKLQVDGSIQASGGYKVAGHPVVTYSSFNLGGGSYATRLGSTGTSTLRHTQIYAGGGHQATFDGANNRLGIGITNPAEKLDVNGTIQCLNELRSKTGNDLLLNAGSVNRDVKIQVNDVNMMYVQGSTGRVGIGTDAPDMALHVLSSSDDVARIQSTNGTRGPALTLDHIGSSPADDDIIGKIVFNGEDDGNNSTTYADIRVISSDVSNGSEDGDITFGTRAAGSYGEKLRIKSDGRLKVSANSSNQWALDVEQQHASSPRGVQINYIAASPDGSSNWFLYCVDDTTARLRISSDGDVWNHDDSFTGSDQTLKENIVDATPKLEDLKKLKVRNFNWKADYFPGKSKTKQIGFIAQEVETVFPALISEHDISPDESGVMKKAIKQAWDPIIIKAMQELIAKVETLEAEVATLKSS